MSPHTPKYLKCCKIPQMSPNTRDDSKHTRMSPNTPECPQITKDVPKLLQMSPNTPEEPKPLLMSRNTPDKNQSQVQLSGVFRSSYTAPPLAVHKVPPSPAGRAFLRGGRVDAVTSCVAGCLGERTGGRSGTWCCCVWPLPRRSPAALRWPAQSYSRGSRLRPEWSREALRLDGGRGGERGEKSNVCMIARYKARVQ